MKLVWMPQALDDLRSMRDYIAMDDLRAESVGAVHALSKLIISELSSGCCPMVFRPMFSRQ